MDIERSFAFPFEDKEWTPKLGLGAAISLVPILNFAWYGYAVGILRNVMNNAPEPLPSWEDFSRKFIDGLLLFAALLIYASPLLFMLCLPLSIMGFSGALSGDNDMQEAARTLAAAGGILLLCFLGLFFLYGIALSILSGAVMVLFAREGTFASCFKLGEALNLIRRNPGSFFTAWGMSLVAGLGIGIVTGLASMFANFIPCFGQIISLALTVASTVYIFVVNAHLYGQFAREVFGTNELTPVG